MKNAKTTQRRKAIDTEKDPYLPKIGPLDMAVCRKCNAVYSGKRWSLSAKPKPGKKGISVLCPACRKIKDRFPRGYVTIKGGFLKAHRDEILNLIRNKEQRAAYLNPLERIIETRERNGEMEVQTTTEKLAQRIGQMLKKAFSGDVEYKWSSDVKLARVIWTRDDE
jgi:NMD protein affecting ribosome stability and mRNA decay